MKNFKISSSTLEYAVLILIVAVALVTMSSYIRRALSGRWREVGDTFGFGRQYGRTVASARKYDCRVVRSYHCQAGKCVVDCSGKGVCPGCGSLVGWGLSDTSMQEACSRAVADMNKNSIYGCSKSTVNWCYWFTTKIIWNADETKLLSKQYVCPGPP